MLAYLDCFSGISGDMLLGALVDAGLELEALRSRLAAMPLRGYQVEVETVTRYGIRGTHVRVKLDQGAPPVARGLADIEGILDASDLPEQVRTRARVVFGRLAAAEAHVHGIEVGAVHFHEVGAVDAIVDVVGAMLGLELLGVDALYCSELPLTAGRVSSEHGELPVPAPATIELLRESRAVWRPLPAEGELVTPTGAAIVAALAQFQRPTMRVTGVGYGFGTRNLPWANCLRLLLGEPHSQADPSEGLMDDFEEDVIAVIEANIDTMTGEALGWLMERLFAAGALDVSYVPLTMKKQRPGTRVTVLAPSEAQAQLAGVILRESTTLGVRTSETRRLKARRRVEVIETPLGSAQVKLKVIGGEVVHVAAEYEDARALAARWGMPLAEVMRQVESAASARFVSGKPGLATDGGDETIGRKRT